jgi:hypothetical protein
MLQRGTQATTLLCVSCTSWRGFDLGAFALPLQMWCVLSFVSAALPGSHKPMSALALLSLYPFGSASLALRAR